MVTRPLDLERYRQIRLRQHYPAISVILALIRSPRLIERARRAGALGWKVNGAGGDGGSLTLLLGADSSQKRSLIEEIESANPLFQNIPLYLSRFGLRVWETA